MKPIKELALLIIEKLGPLVAGIISAGACFFILKTWGIGVGINNLLESAILFATIIIGFVGVLLGILFSIRDSKRIKEFFETKGKDVLKKYFNENITSTILLVTFSMSLYFRSHLASWLENMIVVCWGFLLGFSIASAYRIIKVVMYIVFNSNDDVVTDNRLPIKMDQEEKRALQKKYSEHQ